MAEAPYSSDRLATVFGGSGFVGRHIVRALARAGLARARGGAAAGPGRILQSARGGRANRGGAGQSALSRVDPGGDRGRERGRQRGRRQAPERDGRATRRSTSSAPARSPARRRRRRSAPWRSSPGSAPTRHPEIPISPARARGEEATREAFAGAIVLRPSIVFGPEDEFFNRFAALAPFTPALPLFGGGTTKLQPVFVGDVALAAARALDDSAAAGRTYELGGPEVMSLREAIERTLRIIERRRALVPMPSASRAARQRDGNREHADARQIPEDVDDDAGRNRAAAPGQRGVGRPSPKVARARSRRRRAGLEAIAPAYLYRYRKTGQFEQPLRLRRTRRIGRLRRSTLGALACERHDD